MSDQCASFQVEGQGHETSKRTAACMSALDESIYLLVTMMLSMFFAYVVPVLEERACS